MTPCIIIRYHKDRRWISRNLLGLWGDAIDMVEAFGRLFIVKGSEL